MLTAVTSVGQFDDPQSEAMLTKFLIDRRDAIVRRYLPAVTPVVDVQLSGSRLTFRNAASDAGLTPPPSEYVVQWMRFDNVSGATTTIGTTSAAGEGVPVPADLPSAVGSYIRAEIGVKGNAENEAAPAHAYFRREADRWKLVGFERMPGGNPPRSKHTDTSRNN